MDCGIEFDDSIAQGFRGTHVQRVSVSDRNTRALEPLQRVVLPQAGALGVQLAVAGCGRDVGLTPLLLYNTDLLEAYPESIDQVVEDDVIRSAFRSSNDKLFCRQGNDNLCAGFKATGRDVNGGYAEYMTVPEDFAFGIPQGFSDSEAAPLLCAGAIGYRSLRLTGIRDGQNLGLTGFGASAHLVLKMTRHKYPEARVYVFARTENQKDFAMELGAVWAGDTSDTPPEMLDAVIDTTPAWKPIVEALKSLKSGGRLVINAIRKEDRDKDYLMRLDYPAHLWLEKEIKSVANVAKNDVSEFLALAADIPIKPEVQEFGLEEANKALLELRERKIRGAKVLKV